MPLSQKEQPRCLIITGIDTRNCLLALNIAHTLLVRCALYEVGNLTSENIAVRSALFTPALPTDITNPGSG